MNAKLLKYAQKPKIYEPSTAKFWNDPHISKGMLEAHLNPEWDSATRKHEFVTQSANWIATIMPPSMYPKLLDLGCGPGIYAQMFHNLGYDVTGVDFSERSIEYAMGSASDKSLPITYDCRNYLTLEYHEAFDVVTLIYCDFGVLSDSERKTLLKNIYQALKPNGQLLFDVFTPKEYENKPETSSYAYHESGFWNENPHVCLSARYRYDDQNTFLSKYIIATEDAIECYHVWEHTFTQDELKRDLLEAGFTSVAFYGDVAGAAYQMDGTIICAVAKKEGGITI